MKDLIFGTSAWERFRSYHYPFSAIYYTIEETNRDRDHLTHSHIHDFVTLHYCFDGSYTHIVDGVEYSCDAGSLIIVPPGKSHNYIIKQGDIRSFVQVNILLNFFDNFENDMQLTAITHLFLPSFSAELRAELPIHFIFTGEEKKHADRIFLNLSEYDWNKSVNSYRSLKNSFINLFSHSTFSTLSSETLSRAKKLILRKYIPILRTVYYMNLNFGQKITVDELIELSGLCRTHYFRYFKRMLGYTYSTYLQLIRVSHAEMLCKFSHYSFSYIADICGFGSQGYMNNRIKKQSHLWNKPKDMRRERLSQISKWPNMVMTRDEYILLSPHFHHFGI